MIEGRDTTRTRAERIVALGVVQAPGGHGVFPSLTVEREPAPGDVAARATAARSTRPGVDVLRDVPAPGSSGRGERAGDLSGGEQQMLTLAMALMPRRDLLMIDELSLGLAPEVTAATPSSGCASCRDAGTAIVVVEQSVDRAVELADRAYFLDQGTVRFAGPTAGLLDQPDLVRATFLGAAAASAVTAAALRGRQLRHGRGRDPAGLELTGDPAATSAAWSRSTTCR